MLRSKTPELVRQELYGLLMAHVAIRGLMHEAALRADEDRIVCHFYTLFAWSNGVWPALPLFPPWQRKAFHGAILDELLQERCNSSRNRINPRGVKRKMSNYTLRPRTLQRTRRIDFSKRIRLIC